MTVVMSYRGHQETALQTPPDTTAQKIHDAAQNLDVKLRAVSTGWAFLSALQFFELNITELSGRLRVLVQCLQPRFAVKTLPVREGQWFTDLELCQKGFATIDSEAAMFRTLYPTQSVCWGCARSWPSPRRRCQSSSQCHCQTR
jgi:hypothetical protein